MSVIATDRQCLDAKRGHRVRANGQSQPFGRSASRELGRRRFQPGSQRLDVGRRDGTGNEVGERRAGGPARCGAHRPDVAHERTAAAHFVAPGAAGWSPIPGLDAFDELIDLAIDTLSERVAGRGVAKQRQGVRVGERRPKVVDLAFRDTSSTQVQLRQLVVAVVRRIELAIGGIEQHAQVAEQRAMTGQAQDVPRGLVPLHVARVQEIHGIGVRRGAAAERRIECGVALEQRLPFALRYLPLHEGELEPTTERLRLELQRLTIGVDQRMVGGPVIEIVGVPGFGIVIGDSSKGGQADGLQIPAVEGIREVDEVLRPIVDPHPDQTVVLHEGANVPRHTHDGRRVRKRPPNDQLEPVEAENPLSSLETDRERDESVAPAGEPFRVLVRIKTMAPDPHVIQPTVVTELRPSPGVLLSIALRIPGGAVEQGMELFEMRHIGARQM